MFQRPARVKCLLIARNIVKETLKNRKGNRKPTVFPMVCSNYDPTSHSHEEATTASERPEDAFTEDRQSTGNSTALRNSDIHKHFRC